MVGCAGRSRAFTLALKGRRNTNHASSECFILPCGNRLSLWGQAGVTRGEHGSATPGQTCVESHRRYAHMTQQTWEALKNQGVAMVTRHCSVTGLGEHSNVRFFPGHRSGMPMLTLGAVYLDEIRRRLHESLRCHNKSNGPTITQLTFCQN